MSIVFLEYPKCSTCKKAKEWLIDNHIEFIDRHIVDENPTYAELAVWIEKSELPIRRFFNTSGILYRSLGLAGKLELMSNKEQIELLASDGMLVKRPLIVSDKQIIGGFDVEKYMKILE